MRSVSVGSSSVTNPYISPRYKAEDWRVLNLRGVGSKDWQTAVDIFDDRLWGRFLAPAAAIINHTDSVIQEFSGFAILALDCLVIETLHQFHEGMDETVGLHGEAFWKFFRDSKYFCSEFDTRKKATLFYSHFRCGILHQAQTKKASRVRIGMPAMVQFTIPGDIEAGLTIDRKRFHEALLAEIADYSQRIRTPANRDDLTLRTSFRAKMSLIAAVHRVRAA